MGKRPAAEQPASDGGGGRKTVVIFSVEDAGHINPLIALSEALVQYGLDVQFFAPHTVREKVEGTGATWCHYGTEDWELFACARHVVAEYLRQEPDFNLNINMPHAVVPATLGVLPFLIGRMAQLRPAFLIHDAAVSWGYVLGRLLRIPAICSMTALPPPFADREEFADRWKSKHNLVAAAEALRVAYGFEYNVNYSYSNYQPFTIVWTSRAWHKDHSDFAAKQFHYWGPLVSARRGLSVPALGDRGKPLVFVSLGTVVTGHAISKFKAVVLDFYRKVLAVAAELPDVRFLFAVGTNEDLALGERTLLGVDVPPNMTVEQRVDQPTVLREASAFVTHCGQNSCSEAILYGVPVVAVPIFADQLANADRFEELGCGTVQSYFQGTTVGKEEPKPDLDRVTVSSLNTAVRRVLEEPCFREAMANLSKAQAEECSGGIGSKIEALLEHVAAQDESAMFS